MNDKFTLGDFLFIGLVLFVLSLFLMIPVSCHQSIIRKQSIMAKTGVEMSYWDIVWTDPQIRYNQGQIKIESD